MAVSERATLAVASSRKLPRHKLGALEIGRFMAASLVVLAHLHDVLAPHAAADAVTMLRWLNAPSIIAVQFFFVLSGFVMMTAHRGDFGSLAAVPKFWWRRACRIYPMYWIALLIPLGFFYTLLTPMFTVQLLCLQPVQFADYVPAAWSLRYEVSFYIMFGLCLLPYLGRPLLALWVIAVFWNWCPAAWVNAAGLPMPRLLYLLARYYAPGMMAFFNFLFFAGLLGGWIFTSVTLGRLAGWALTIIAVLLLAVVLPLLQWGYNYPAPFAEIVVGLDFTGLILGISVLERNGVFHCGKTAKWLGAMSYPLYILHMPLLLLVSVAAPKLRLHAPAMTVAILVALLGVYIISAGFTSMVDQPLQNRLRRWRRASGAMPG